jgi:serine/threonine protein kinase
MEKDFGAYELRDRIGKGGMAWVYLAVQKNLDRPVALKILFPHLAEDDALVARFQLEAKSAAAMRHENVCQVYDFGRHGDQFFIAMEYVEGKNLREWIDAHGPPPLEIGLLMLRDICRGLEHAHRRNIIHRDIKPSNVMFTPDGVIKLMDFGLARRVEDRSGITMYGAMLGTPAYMSPEQARGERLERPTTDIFSFGIVCYELLGGLRPFQGDSSSVARAIMYSEPRPLDALDPLVPSGVEAMIRRMLEKNIEQRVQTVAEVRHAFDAAIQELGITHERELLADFAADPAGVGSVLRARRLARHLEGVREAEGRNDATSLLREHRRVLHLDPKNETSAAYVKEHDVPSPLGAAPPVDEIEHTVYWTPPATGGSRPPSVSPEAETMPPSRPPESAPPSSATPPAPTDAPDVTVMYDPSRPTVSRIDPVSPPVSPPSRVTPPAPPPPPPPPPAAKPKPEESRKPAPASAKSPVPMIAIAAVVLLLAIGGIVFLMTRRHEAAPPAPVSGIPVPGAVSVPPGGEATPVPGGAPMTSAAALTITVEPEGAQVSLDGGVTQPAPARFTELAAGSHTVRVMRDSFQTARRVLHLVAGKDTTLAFKLKPSEKGTHEVLALHVATEPADATVALDGEAPQPSPATFHRVPAGEHTIEVRREGFTTVTQAFSVGAQAETTLTIRLAALRAAPMRNVTVRTVPTGAQVSIDDLTARRDPGRFDNIRAGVHRARASLSGYGDVEQAFGLSGQRDTTITLRLTPSNVASGGATGVLNVWVRPAGTILLDRAPYRADVESLVVVLQADREYLVGLQPRWGGRGDFVSEPVRLKAGQSRVFGYDFRGSMSRYDVSSTGGPPAEIVLDGKPTGLQTPNTIYTGSGTHRFDLSVEGWKTHEGTQTVKLKGGQAQAITFTLARP